MAWGAWEPAQTLPTTVTSSGSQPQLALWSAPAQLSQLAVETPKPQGAVLIEGRVVGPLCGQGSETGGGAGPALQERSESLLSPSVGGQGLGLWRNERTQLGQHTVGPHSALS